MVARSEPDGREPDPEVRRQTWLKAEPTSFASWRTGLGAATVAVGAGRLLPGLNNGAALPLKLLGIGYGVLAIAMPVIAAARERHVSLAPATGGYHGLSAPLVTWLTVAVR